MGIWDIAKRVGLGVATGGISEAGGARPLLDAAGGSDYTKNLLFGGDATKGIDTQPGHYDQATNQLGQMAGGAQLRTAPVANAAMGQAAQLGQAYQLAPGQMDQSRGGMLGVANNLGAIASGQHAGAGELAVNRQLGQTNAALTSAARQAHGANAALAYRNMARGQVDAGFAGAGQAAQAQMQDQQAANAQLGQLYGGMYGQDANVAAQNAQLGQQAMLQQGQFQQQTNLANQGAQQQTNLANQGAQLSQQQMNDAYQLQSMGQMLGWDQARINAELAKAGIAATDKGILPGLLQMGGQIGAAYATGGASMAAGGGGGAPAPAAAPPINNPYNPYGWTPGHG